MMLISFPFSPHCPKCATKCHNTDYLKIVIHLNNNNQCTYGFTSHIPDNSLLKRFYRLLKIT